jgi:hypothetical protein
VNLANQDNDLLFQNGTQCGRLRKIFADLVGGLWLVKFLVGRAVICDAVCHYHDCLAMALFMEPLRSALFLARAARKWYLFETTPLCAARWVLVECGVLLFVSSRLRIRTGQMVCPKFCSA